MNKYLADSLAGLNYFSNSCYSYFCIRFCRSYWYFIGFVVGGAVGFLLASMICGTFALLIDIRNEVVRLNESLDKN